MIPLERIREIKSSREKCYAIIDKNVRVTWAEYEHIVTILLSNITNEIDVTKIKTVCFLSPNRKELIYLASTFSTLKIPFIGIDYTQHNGNIFDMLEICECSILIISSLFCLENNIKLPALSSDRKLVDLDCLFSGAINYNDLIIDHSNKIEIRNFSRPYNGISFTSGTSGTPKAAVRTKSFDLRRFTYFTLKYGFNSHDRHLLIMPLYHAAGNGWARLFMSLGATIIVADQTNLEDATLIILNEQITTSAMTPTILKGIVKNYKRIDIRNNYLKFILVSGKHFTSEAKIDAINTMGSVIYEYYGTTETGVNTIAEPRDLIKNPESVGRPYDGNEVIILDKNNNVLENKKKGRVAISSYMNMNNYKNAEKQSIVYNEKEFLVTPETGYLDEDGYLYLSNRTQGITTKDLYGVQNLIEKINGVVDCAIITDNTKSSSFICAYECEGNSNNEFNRIEHDIYTVLRKNKINISLVKCVKAIPYSPSGKIKADELINIVHEQEPETKNKKQSELLNNPNRSISNFILGILFLIFTAVSWGAMFPITKNALKYTDAVTITLIRYGVASLIFIGILVIKEGLKSLIPDKNFGKLWLFGTLGFAGFSILAFAGLSMTKAEHGAIIMSLMPLLTAIMIWVLKKQKPRKTTFISIILAFTGVFLVITKGSLSSIYDANLFAGLIILLGAFCWVTYTIGASYVSNYSALRYTAISCFLGALSILFIAIFSYKFDIISLPNIDTLNEIKYELLYLIIIAGVFAVFAWNKGITTLGPLNGILFINLVPITAFLIGLARGISFNNIEIIGMMLTIFSIIMNNVASRFK